MEINLPSEKKGLMFRSLSLAEFSPTKASNAQQPFAQSCSLIRHISCEQIFFSPKKYTLKRSVTEKINIVEPDAESMTKESGSCSESVVGIDNKCAKAGLFLPKTSKADPEPIKKNEGQPCSRKYKKGGIRRLRDSEEPYEMSETNKMSCIFYILLPLIVLFCGSLPFYYNSQPWAIPPDLRVCREVVPDVTSLKNALEKQMFGQQNAINKIVKSLRIFYTSRYPEVKVFALAGGIGVGKSFMSSLLSKYFPWKNNVEHLFWPVHHKEISGTELYKKLSFCGVNLIIIDDIGISQANNAIELVKEVTEFSKQDHVRTLIILVFNFLESQQNISFKDVHNVTSCKNHMEKIFKLKGVDSEIICFENLEKCHIIKCIETAAHEKGIEWTREKTNDVLAQLDSSTGCKGVNSKIQLVHSEMYKKLKYS